MAYSLPIITVLVFISPGLLLAGEPLRGDPVRNGNELVESAMTSLVGLPAMEAKVRQRATIFGQLLAGVGLYAQAPGGDAPRVRFELQLQVADQSLSVLQINDGSTLWMRRDDSRGMRQSYVDLRQLRDAANRPTQAVSGGASGVQGALAMGGLVQLLRQLSQNFDFEEPQPVQVAGRPSWEVRGQWKRPRLADLLPGQRDRIESGQACDLSQLPGHLPTTVRLTLGRDPPFPLFPYRIEYSRAESVATGTTGPGTTGPGTTGPGTTGPGTTGPGTSGPGTSGPGTTGPGNREPGAVVVRPLVTMEFYELRSRPDLDPGFFRFVPGDAAVEDQTESFLRSLRWTEP